MKSWARQAEAEEVVGNSLREQQIRPHRLATFHDHFNHSSHSPFRPISKCFPSNKGGERSKQCFILHQSACEVVKSPLTLGCFSKENIPHKNTMQVYNPSLLRIVNYLDWEVSATSVHLPTYRSTSLSRVYLLEPAEVSKTRRAKKTNGYRMAAPMSVEPGP